jgi:hypothetical protein
VKVGVSVGLTVGVGLGVRVSVGVGVAVGTGVSVGVGVGVWVNVGVGVSVGVGVGVWVNVGVGVSVAVAVKVGRKETVEVAVDEGVGNNAALTVCWSSPPTRANKPPIRKARMQRSVAPPMLDIKRRARWALTASLPLARTAEAVRSTGRGGP